MQKSLALPSRPDRPGMMFVTESAGAEREWYLIYSKPQQEEIARFHLSRKGLEIFFPKLLLPYASRKRKRIAPLFPNYLFVRLRLLSEEFSMAQWSPGVNRIVSFNGMPTPIDDRIIEVLMQQANADGLIEARPKLRPGQQVRISGGVFDGLLGVIQDPPNAKGRIKILMQLLSRSTPIELPIEFVETEWIARADRFPVTAQLASGANGAGRRSS